MLDTEAVKKLAFLSRIAISQEEAEALKGSLEGILGYVDQIRSIAGEASPASLSLINRGREDIVVAALEETHTIILEDMPEREGDYLRVKKVL